ncbi:vWA domain-containing protein [Microvirga lotononidis]|uniref:Protein containing von Willebrand factor type A (VWA) domain n=1 Tax=Microvirga lotononidis TaxID=864069 RepID=I4YU58_9HYPH|nr:VWA domain-containing protein [Microvirga lotononidis]EIM27500.1 protein containing von Willebrand factor type A (vWA) domain [Microvirga lotononidis]WQO28348.1 VWA domain-containing protein [Microvirga lotononidis]
MTDALASRGEGRLADNIAYFARALRAAGLPVGPGAVLDAIAAVATVGIGPREDFYWILHAVFVKRHEHSILFDQAFRIFWRRRALIEKLIAQMSPVAPGRAQEEKAPKAGALRVAEALATPRQEKPDPVERTEFSARLTVSDREVLKVKDFAQMSAAEIAMAKRLIADISLPDDEVTTRRFLSDPRGRRIDPRRTFRRSLRGGGAVIDLAYRSPAVRHAPVVALVDISGSMADYSRVFLHFLHAIAEKRRRIHSFVFATRLTNISRELMSRDPDEALARASKRVQDWEGGTRIAHALHEFNRHWSRRVLGQGAIVLLFTDGLEREVTPELTFEMDRLKRSCRRLVWLNPLLRFDAFEARASGIRAMLPHVDEFRPIHNLASMEDLCRTLSGDPSKRAFPRQWLRAS